MAEENSKPPVGAAKRQVLGLGSYNAEGGLPGPMMMDVFAMLAAGSPRLALAKALGVPLAPYLINIRATFADTDTDTIPTVGADVKIVQDTLITGMMVRIVNESSTANQNQFQSQADFYYTIQSGIDATLQVDGAPRYSVAPKPTPLATMCDFFNGSGFYPNGWVLTYQQQLGMAFFTNVDLPYAPLEIIVTFRGWVPTNDMFVDMKNREALCILRDKCGIDCGEAYELGVCR